MSLRSMMTDTCNTYSLKVKQDRLSANFDDYELKATDVPCLANILSAKSIVYFGQFGMQLDATFGFATDPNLNQYDLIEHDGRVYSVDGVRPIVKKKAWEVRCIRYDPQRVA